VVEIGTVTAQNDKILPDNPVTCKYCNSRSVVRFGKYKEIQRYYCKACNHKFKADDSLIHGRVHSFYVTQTMTGCYTGHSINEIRETFYRKHQYKPAKSTFKKWVLKYTDLAVKNFQDYHPLVGDIWICDESRAELRRKLKVWIYNVIDKETRFLLASHVAFSRKTKEVELVIREAQKRANKSPKIILTDADRSYKDGIELVFGADTEHVSTKSIQPGDIAQMVDLYHETYKEWIETMPAVKDLEIFKQFNNGWSVCYNYFKPHPSLNGRTPAEEAKIQYDIKNWSDLIHSVR
jgi:putative transposase